MFKISIRASALKLGAIAGAGLVLQACTPSMTGVEKEALFFDEFVGTKLVRDEGHTTVKRNGTFVGEADGGALRGQWEWKDGKFCRSGSWNGNPFPYACETITIIGDSVTFAGPDGRFTYSKS